jgi:hypothetical protein
VPAHRGHRRHPRWPRACALSRGDRPRDAQGRPCRILGAGGAPMGDKTPKRPPKPKKPKPKPA